MTERHWADPITVTCLAAGSYTLSAGSMEPAIVLERLLVVLSVLDLSAYRRLIAPDGPFAAAPAAALCDGASSWWGSDEADVLLESVFGAINAAAPAGYACCYTQADRIELVRVEGEARTRSDVVLSVPPHISAVRARVR